MSGVNEGWRAEADDEKDRRIEKLRQMGLIVVAAVVLLPPYLLVVLTIMAGVVYICIMMVRRLIRAQ